MRRDPIWRLMAFVMLFFFVTLVQPDKPRDSLSFITIQEGASGPHAYFRLSSIY